MKRLPATLAILALTTTATAQWSDDAGVNLAVVDGGDSPAVTHCASDGDGGAWIAWYNASAGYDVMTQHIDAVGTSTFITPVLVDDQNNSSVQDFDLITDTFGRAVLAWPAASAIKVACVEFDGSIAWSGAFGDSSAFLAQAQLAALPDGGIALAWGEDDRSVLQRLTATGAADGPSVAVTLGGTLIPSSLQPAEDGSFIASFVFYTTFTGPKRLKAQKYDATMTPLWGSNPIDVFTTGSLQFGNFPEFVPDTAGGGVFCWYDTGSTGLMSRIQWIDTNGTVLLGTNGLATTTETSMVHVNPQACVDPASGEATVFWVRQNSSQSNSGIQANRFDPAGNRLWGPTGVTAMPMALSTGCLDLHAVQVGELATGSWFTDPTLGAERVMGTAFDALGTAAWPTTPTTISNAPGTKDDMTSCAGTDMLITFWVDDRAGGDSLYVQNINDNGTLGIEATCPGDINDDGQVGVDDLLAVIAGWQDPYTVDDLLIVIGAWGQCD